VTGWKKSVHIERLDTALKSSNRSPMPRGRPLEFVKLAFGQRNRGTADPAFPP
jgi:hypothetical protein